MIRNTVERVSARIDWSAFITTDEIIPPRDPDEEDEEDEEGEEGDRADEPAVVREPDED